MVWAWIAGGVIGLSLITLSLGASIAIVRSEAMGTRQKMAGFAVVWLVPLLGPMRMLHRLQETEPGAVPREIVAASGLGWGLLGDSDERANTRGNHESAGESGDRIGGDGGDGRGGP